MRPPYPVALVVDPRVGTGPPRVGAGGATTGRIEGTVKDQTGGSSRRHRDADLGHRHKTAVTDDNGVYSFIFWSRGLFAQKRAGWIQIIEAEGIGVRLGVTSTSTWSSSRAKSADVITVTGEAPMVDTPPHNRRNLRGLYLNCPCSATSRSLCHGRRERRRGDRRQQPSSAVLRPGKNKCGRGTQRPGLRLGGFYSVYGRGRGV